MVQDSKGSVWVPVHPSQALVQAKCLCKILWERFTKTPVPELGPRPHNQYERTLFEVCDDSDYDSKTASPKTKRAKIAEMKERHKNGELSENALSVLDRYRGSMEFETD